jgi:hypothetical protein
MGRWKIRGIKFKSGEKDVYKEPDEEGEKGNI